MDSHIVAVAMACGLEPWILADFDSADHALHEPYSSPCNVSHLTQYRGKHEACVSSYLSMSSLIFSRLEPALLALALQ
jgi:hypothetical protein